ncbi:ABC transporter substrate-binding protein [Acinetobacter qingfengensis]|uniref:ABC transporter substrate-binding protein n=1 Tax=Acinetobacter qingfengensis TaxID=1262585 RepID=A0A1E7R523_9GAMM|nr:ABC transporter substrate-binding protein [Acinetobacter qingfengensis]KAA8732430.1 ABC transporter substrate-binding protein [Acinetobacter qingfengensis]OEY94424.1 ABC transporter substrate-binding protein [Acinetobacter qingfengensis]
MINRTATLTLSVILGMLLTACDNTAKTPDTQTKSEQSSTTNSKPITIGYSDWPGWVAWQIAIDKGWLKEAGLNVDFKWFDYSSSLNAFSANQLDAVMVTNGDNLITSSGGTKGIIIMATDYSAGNDVIIAKDGINNIADLKGKWIATEKGLVDHLLLSTALDDAKIPLSDIKLVNSVTNELPQVFASKDISAIAVWQPVASQALKSVAGSKIIYTSKDKPGLIYDTVSVNMNSLTQNKEQWTKFVQVWDKVVNYIQDPKTHDDAVKIMANRVGVDPSQYAKMIDGTHFLSLQENKKVFAKGAALDSIYGSSYHVNEFNVKNGIYQTLVDVDSLIDPTIVQGSN